MTARETRTPVNPQANPQTHEQDTQRDTLDQTSTIQTRRRIARLVPKAAAALALALLLPPAQAREGLALFEPVILTRAEAALEHDQPKRALALLEVQEAGIKSRNDRATLLGLKCRAHLSLEQADEAATACEAAIATRGGSATWRFHNNLGVAELARGDFARAAVAFRNARTLNPRSTAPRRNLRILAALEDGLTSSTEAVAQTMTPTRSEVTADPTH